MKNLVQIAVLVLIAGVTVWYLSQQKKEKARKQKVIQDNKALVDRFESYGGGL